MDKRENILEAWIMVEHLSEGDIKLNDNLLKKLEIPKDRDYYSLLNEEIQGQNLSNDKGGIVLYFNTYPFSTVIQLQSEGKLISHRYLIICLRKIIFLS